MKKTVLAFALVAASCAFASDKFWYPQSGSTAWSGRNWIGIGGDCFEDGDNAVFSDYYGDKTASATVDTDVTAAKISASIPTTISKGEAATTNSYTYFRRHGHNTREYPAVLRFIYSERGRRKVP